MIVIEKNYESRPIAYARNDQRRATSRLMFIQNKFNNMCMLYNNDGERNKYKHK